MKPEHLHWCRNLFASLNEGGAWGLPACGLIFRKMAGELVLVARMPHDPAMPMSAAELQAYQDREYENNRRHFEAAGIHVRSACVPD